MSGGVEWYALLRNHDERAYEKAIQYAEGVTLKHNLGVLAAADCEVACVMLACEILGLSLPRQASP